MRAARLTRVLVGLSVGCALALGIGLDGASPAVAKERGATTTTAKAKMSAAAKKKAAALAKAKAQATAKAKAKAAARARAKAAAQAKWNRATSAGPLAVKTARIAAAARAKAVKASSKAARDQAKVISAMRSRKAAKAKLAVAVKKRQRVWSAKEAVKKATRKAKKAKARARKSAAKAAKVNAAYGAKATAAARARAAAGPAYGWAPSNKTVFNNPKGSRYSEHAIISQLATAIDATPVSGEIWMAQFLLDIPALTTKLIAAHRRGAYVRILIDNGEKGREIRRLRKVLGTNKKARSFVATCRHGCMSSKPSNQHAKFFLFSVAGKGRLVSMISSANPYGENVYNSWNNHHTIVGDAKIYSSLRTYFIDMMADRNNANYFRVTGSGKYTIYMYPRKARRPKDIVVLRALKQVSCKKTKKGYGTKARRTMVRVANWGWTGARLDVARRLWTLHNHGCKVQVMINRGRIQKDVLQVLLRPSPKYGRMPVYDAWHDRNRDDIASLYVHHKMITIDGRLRKGRHVKITWTGSQNFTAGGTLRNNEIVLRIVDPAVVHAYNVNFAYIRQHHTRRLRAVPARTGPI